MSAARREMTNDGGQKTFLTSSASLVLLAILLAFALRVYHLAAHGLWYDEAFSSWIVAKDWAGILEFARAPKLEHPPTYYFLLHAWQIFAGDSEFALRFFSVGFSVLCVALLFAFTRRWFGTTLARWTIFVAALSPFLIVYAQEARMYTLVLCVCLVALDQFLRWLAGDQRAWRWYLLFTLLSLTIHYYAALLLVVENIFWLLSVRALPSASRRRSVTPWMAWNALLIALSASVIVLAPGPRETLALVFAHPLFAGRSAEELQRVMVDLLIGGVVIRPLALADVLWSTLLLVVVVVGAFVLPRLVEPARARLIWLMLLVPPVVAAAVPMIYAARYLFLLVPALIICSAAVLQWLFARRVLFAAVLAVMLLAMGYALNWNYQFAKSDYREMAAIITRDARAGDGLVLAGVSQWPLAFYYLRGWSQTYIPQNPEAAELSDIDADMRSMQQTHPRVWLVNEQSWVVDPADNAMRWLSLNAYPITRQWFRSSNAVSLYLSGNAFPTTRKWDAQFGEWLLLEQSALSSTDVSAGDALAVRLRWHALKKIPQPMQLLVTLRVLDAQGNSVQERVSKPCDGFCAIDDWLVGDSTEDHNALLVPNAAAVGEYTLRLEVYAPRQGQSLPIKSAQGDLGASLELARIHVQRANGQ